MEDLTAQAVRKLRGEKGWSQERLAQEAKITKQTIYDLEGGRTSPRLVTLDKISQALGVPTASLVNGEVGAA